MTAVVEAYRAWAPDRRAIVLCTSTEHAVMTAAAFDAAGIRAAVLLGNTPATRCREILADHLAGNLRVLCGVNAIIDGDLRALRSPAVISARPTASRALFYRQVMLADPRDGVFIDMAGNCFRHMDLPSEFRGRLVVETRAVP